MQTSWSYSLVDTSLTLYTSDMLICFFILNLHMILFITDEAVTAGPIVCKPRWWAKVWVRLFLMCSHFYEPPKIFLSAMLTYWHLKVKLWPLYCLIVFFYVYLTNKMQVKEPSIKKLLIQNGYIFIPCIFVWRNGTKVILHGPVWIC